MAKATALANDGTAKVLNGIRKAAKNTTFETLVLKKTAETINVVGWTKEGGHQILGYYWVNSNKWDSNVEPIHRALAARVGVDVALISIDNWPTCADKLAEVYQREGLAKTVVVQDLMHQTRRITSSANKFCGAAVERNCMGFQEVTIMRVSVSGCCYHDVY